VPFSEFNYLTPTRLVQLVHTISGISDQDQAVKFISDAERIIDAYAGPAPRFYLPITGTTSAAVASGATTFPSTMFGSRRPNYWGKGGAYVEVTNGSDATLVGQSRLVVASTDNQVTLGSGFDALVPSATEFEFRQRSVFPRWVDRDSWGTPRMPVPDLEVATAYQVEFGIQFGSEAFGLGDAGVIDDPLTGIQSRTYGTGYSESRVAGERVGLAVYLSPKARGVMRRILNVTGRTRA
jgi:hypothetical protein